MTSIALRDTVTPSILLEDDGPFIICILHSEGGVDMSQVTSDFEVLLDVMRRKRNIRRFKPDPVPDEYINAIVEAGRLAPSGANSQPWEFIVIKDPERKMQASEIFKETARKGREFDPAFPTISLKTVERRVAEAPALIAVVGDQRLKEAYPGYGFRDAIFYVSLGAAMEHMHLAATALGLAMCWATVNRFSEEPLGELLGVKQPLIVKEVFSVGYPIAIPPAKYRRPLNEVLHFEQLDTSKLRTDEQIRTMIQTRRSPSIYAGPEAES